MFQGLVNSTWMYETHIGRDAVNLSHEGIQIKEIYHIQNHTLWQEYEVQRNMFSRKAVRRPRGRFLRIHEVRADDDTEVEPVLSRYFDPESLGHKRCDEDLNEVFLFHGTPKDNVDGIVKNGFNIAKANEGLYGKAVYLAESAEKADQYAGIIVFLNCLCRCIANGVWPLI